MDGNKVKNIKCCLGFKVYYDVLKIATIIVSKVKWHRSWLEKHSKGNTGLACVFLLAAAQLLTVKDPLQRVAKGACSSRVGSLLEHLVVPYKDIPVTSPFATTMAHHFSGRNRARNMLQHLFIQYKEIRKSSTTTAKKIPLRFCHELRFCDWHIENISV
jgi:hypothetical protein